MIKKDSSEDLVRKFAAGTCSKKEAMLVIKLFGEQDNQKDLYQSVAKLWYQQLESEDDSEETIDMSTTLDRLHHRINHLRENEESILRRKDRFRKGLLKLASVLFLPLLITSALYIYEKVNLASEGEFYTKINTIPGSQLRTELPDGTVVWLNSSSTLKYPQSFSKRNREVIISGEAYFDVKHDKFHPFMVRTDMLDIKVLGTKFNVMAYPEEYYVATTLEEGHLLIEKPVSGRRNSKLCVLETGERVVYDRNTGSINKFETETEKFTSWKEGKLIFRNDPLAMVIKRLERWYNVDILISDDLDLSGTPYTMTIVDETITQVLEYLKVASPISWEMIPAQKSEDGELSVAKYIIRSKNFHN
jgi:transmembrane sensor